MITCGRIYKMQFSEAQTRTIIDQQLKDVGWNPKDPNSVQMEMRSDQFQMDYVFKNKQGHPLAVLEAKKKDNDPRAADSKTKKYAEKIKVPFIFLANGEKIFFWEYQKEAYPRPVNTFYSQDDLERKYSSYKMRKNLSDVKIDSNITDRPYQIECINKISTEILEGKSKFLVEMATGAGKTRLAISLCKRLFQSSIVSKVLFICDRVSLAQQTDKNFKKFLPEESSYILNSKGFKSEKSITISTLQTFIMQYNQISAGYFDLIIVDECHRSIYGKYKKTLTRFDSLKLGLTATPCKYTGDEIEDSEDYKIIRDTLQFFNLKEPTYKYDLQTAIREKYLVPYLIYTAKTIKTSNEEGIEIHKNEIDWSNIDLKDKEELEKIFSENEKAIIPHTWLERKITIPSRNIAIVNEFRDVLENGYKDEKGNIRRPIVGKTIVFAVTQSHAITLAKMFNDKFSDVLKDKSKRYADFVISQNGEDNINDAKNKIDNFIEKKYPQILVSVGMLDTGFDCPEITNLVFARFTKSNILYRQMRGRGTRKAPHIKKENFWIFDFAGNVNYHGDNESGDGGLVVIKPNKIKSEPKGLIEIDVEDFIDPASRQIIDLDENGVVKRSEVQDLKVKDLTFKYEEWINKKEDLDLNKEKFVRTIGEYLKSNIDDIKELNESDFTYAPFIDLPFKGEVLFHGRENFNKLINEINENIVK